MLPQGDSNGIVSEDGLLFCHVPSEGISIDIPYVDGMKLRSCTLKQYFAGTLKARLNGYGVLLWNLLLGPIFSFLTIDRKITLNGM